jgi:BirA family biotin operon repressor/biotin-[acetyl-CoA-carboxylase] ligase
MPVDSGKRVSRGRPTKEDQIIQFLIGQAGYFSGEEIARRLRISRTAVWNHIHNLKKLGFAIESLPHLGYKLVRSPDKLLPTLVSIGLKSNLIGNRIYHFDTVTSSSDEADRFAKRGEPEGAVIIAEEQTAGRGRMGRTWHSTSGKGVYLSVILRPSLSPTRIPFLTLCAAISVTDAIRGCTGLKAFVKWPNDVLISDKKVSGILSELSTEADRINYAIVGVGINANNLREDFPAGLNATSLKIETGRSISRLELTRLFLRILDENYALLLRGDYSELIEQWLRVSATIGRRVRIETTTGRFREGVATGLDDDGCLLLRLDSGMTQRITGGDVYIVRTQG